MNMTRRKKIFRVRAAMSCRWSRQLVLLLVAELVVHNRAERTAGLNRWGYRGPVVGGKKTGELRV